MKCNNILIKPEPKAASMQFVTKSIALEHIPVMLLQKQSGSTFFIKIINSANLNISISLFVASNIKDGFEVFCTYFRQS
jgi:hypothetical protein